jgi:hypothetical protein
MWGGGAKAYKNGVCYNVECTGKVRTPILCSFPGVSSGAFGRVTRNSSGENSGITGASGVTYRNDDYFFQDSDLA